jgi:hypothetical protein
LLRAERASRDAETGLQGPESVLRHAEIGLRAAEMAL